MHMRTHSRNIHWGVHAQLKKYSEEICDGIFLDNHFGVSVHDLNLLVVLIMKLKLCETACHSYDLMLHVFPPVRRH